MKVTEFCKMVLDYTEKAVDYNPEVEIYFTVGDELDCFSPDNISYTLRFDKDDETKYVIVNLN